MKVDDVLKKGKLKVEVEFNKRPYISLQLSTASALVFHDKPETLIIQEMKEDFKDAIKKILKIVNESRR